MCVLALWGTVRADVISSNFTDKNLSVQEGELVWTSSVAPNAFDNPNASATYEARGVQFGTSANPIGEFTLTSASALSKVTEVKIVASASGAGNTLAVKVGDVDFAGDGAVQSGTANANLVYTFTGEATDGVITILANDILKAMYIKSVEVTYAGEGGETPEEPQPDPVVIAAPVLSPTEGYVANTVDVTITAEEGLTVHYTTDGTEPTTESAVYSEPVNITAVDEKVVVTVKAIAVDGEGNKSDVVSFTYNVLVVKPMEVPEGCVGFDFVMNPWELPLGSSGNDNAGNISAPIVQDGVTLTVSGGSTNPRMWSYNAGGQLRLYKGATMSIAAPSGKLVTSVVLNAGAGTFVAGNGAWDAGTKTWTGIESEAVINVDASSKTCQINTILVILSDKEAVFVEAPVITPATGTYTEPQTVTITAEEGLTVYYTVGDAEDVKTYSEPFTVSETTTVAAWAVDAEDNKSQVVTSVITIESLPEYATIAAMKDAATTDKVKSLFKFENLLVTGVAKTSLYVSDGTDGFLFYGVTPTVKKGDKISGTITGELYLYSDLTEMAGVDYSNVTVVSEGNEVVPAVVTIADIVNGTGLKDYENEYVQLQNVNFAAEGLTSKNVTLVDESDNEILLRDNFGVLTDMVFDTEKSYNVNVFVANYKGTAQLYPLTAAEVQIITELAVPESAWENDSIVLMAGDAREIQNKFTTNSDGAVTYTSTDESVVVVDENGNLTWKADGVATVYAETAETENYLASKVGFVFAAINGSGTLDAPYTVADAQFLNGTRYLTGEKVWVKAYVVGYVNGQNINSGAIFEAPAAEDGIKTNALLAENVDETEVAECLPVQLPAGFVREGVQPSTAYKSVVWLYGNIEKYFGVAGLKSVTDYSFDGENVATGINAVETEGMNAPKSVYTLAGQKVDVITKGGVYIIDGKKVLVK